MGMQTIATAPINVTFTLKGIGEVNIRVPRDRKIITPINLSKIDQMSRIDYTTGRFIGFRSDTN